MNEQDQAGDLTATTGGLPLAGIRVLDFGQYIAGPAAAMMLADQGAEVIHIDPPGGPRWQSPAAVVLNRRKKCITLDLKQPDGLAIARDLALRSDVLIENFRPGVMNRLGLGAAEIRALNPSLVYVSLPGFAATDRDFAHLAAWEGIIAAAAGQFNDMGLNRVLMGINPSFSPLCLPSAYGAALGATSAVLALYARAGRGGRGDHVEVPLVSALMEGLAYNSMRVAPYPQRYHSLREREIARRRAAGEKMDMSYDDLQSLLDPFYRSYLCADDRPFYVVCASHRVHVRKLLDLLNLLEPLRAAGMPELADWYLPKAEWPEGADGSPGLYPTPQPWAERITLAMAALFRTRTSFDWEDIFGAAGIPGAAHRLTEEWLASPHPREAGLLIETIDAEKGRILQPGPLAWLQHTAAAATEPTQVAKPDTDRDTILAMAQAPADKPNGTANAVADEAPWLAGIRILDLTNVIAGPTIAALLARFGAEVIKLDPTRPNFDPWTTIVFGMQGNQGKNSLLADLKNETGQEILHRLLRWADVITVNANERQLADLHLTPARIAAVNPRAILCRIDAFGGPKSGPRSAYPGYDDLVQASTGIMARFGGSLQTPEEHAHVGTIDVLCGFCGALATAMALFHRQRTGRASLARSSLAAAGQLIQAPFMYHFDGRPPHDEPRGPKAQGDGPLYRCYAAHDGWFFLAAKSEQWPMLSRLAAVDHPWQLEARFGQASREHWLAHLQEMDIAAVAIGSLAAWRDAPVDAGSSFRFDHHDDHPSGHHVDLAAANAVRPAESQLKMLSPAEKYGASTRRILAELGYAPDAVAALLAAGIVSESWSRQYLPD
ncbi:MAG TPA: CoA transferase [Dongiaceae bacterium]|nr:CoA transferase [Dongiaceae bacterium]